MEEVIFNQIESLIKIYFQRSQDSFKNFPNTINKIL